MIAYVLDAAFRGAISVPIIIAVMSLIWAARRKLGAVGYNDRFDAADMRTWPLSKVVAYAAVFGALFAAFSAAVGETTLGLAGAAAASAFIAGVLARVTHRPHSD